MKIVVLLDGSNNSFSKMIDIVSNKKGLFIDTKDTDEVHEYNYLSHCIDSFSKSDNEIMLTRFSGRDSVVKNLGDEHSEMIVALSYNKDSRFYTGCPVNTFSDIVNIFEKENI